MAITRRQFLRRSGLAAGGLATYGLFGSPLVRRALADVGDKYLVVLFLDGGNDGLNTVTPISDGSASLRLHYQAQRNNLRLPTDQLLPIGAGQGPPGLHRLEPLDGAAVRSDDEVVEAHG